MAQIIISTLDSKNGSVSVTANISDKDLNRIYDAYKHDYAQSLLEQKRNNGEVLENYDTIEIIQSKISSEEILSDLMERFCKDIINVTHHTETNISLSKIRSELTRIEIEI